MEQNEASISMYKAGAAVMLGTCKTYFTYMERLRNLQRRTDAEFAETAGQCAEKLKGANDMAQCSSWQRQAYAEQIGRWNQYALELIQIAAEGQSLSQAALRESLDHIQQAYVAMMAHMPMMPYIIPTGTDLVPPANRKSNSQRAVAH